MTSPSKAAIVLAILLSLIAGGLYVATLVNLFAPSYGGESNIAQAFEALFLNAGLWIALALLIIVGALAGVMPRWAAILAIFVLPLAGVAAFIAMDAFGRGVKLAIAAPALSPPLIAFYALWCCAPGVHPKLSPNAPSVIVWSLVIALTILAPLIAMAY